MLPDSITGVTKASLILVELVAELWQQDVSKRISVSNIEFSVINTVRIVLNLIHMQVWKSCNSKNWSPTATWSKSSVVSDVV